MATVPPEGWLVPGTPQLLKGGDRFVSAAMGTAVAVGTVADFWSWAFSDLRDNSLRGILAEFIVGSALDATAIRRKAWDNYDLLTPDGVRVEVKASGYLQVWPQARHSRLVFGRVAARPWDETTNTYGGQAEVRADVFVFAVQTCTDHALYNALDLDQWVFYVVSAASVRATGAKSIGISWVRQRAHTTGFDDLADTVRETADSHT